MLKNKINWMVCKKFWFTYTNLSGNHDNFFKMTEKI